MVKQGKPERMKIHKGNIPQELKDLPQWVIWKYIWDQDKGKWDKPPFRAKNKRRHASSTNRKTWATLDEAVKVANSLGDEDYGGVGFAGLDGLGFVGIDLDKCYNHETRQLTKWANKIIDHFNSYTEITPSQNGVRIWIRGKKPGPKCKKQNLSDIFAGNDGAVEIYEHGRYFTVTGHILDGLPIEVAERQEELNFFYSEEFDEKESSEEDGSSKEKKEPPKAPHSHTDEEVLEAARRAKNGEKFSLLFDDEDAYEKLYYPTQSEADLALYGMLAFWVGYDQERIDRLFLQSALGKRDKARREGYRKRLFDKISENPGKVWQGRQKEQSETKADETKAEPAPIAAPSGTTVIGFSDSQSATSFEGILIENEEAVVMPAKAEEIPLHLEETYVGKDAVLYPSKNKQSITLAKSHAWVLAKVCRTVLVIEDIPGRAIQHVYEWIDNNLRVTDNETGEVYDFTEEQVLEQLRTKYEELRDSSHDYVLDSPLRALEKLARTRVETSELAKDRPAPEHIIEPLMEEGKIVLVFGRYGSGKSYVGLELTARAQHGGMAFGFLPVRKTVQTCYFDAEMSFKGDFEPRAKALGLDDTIVLSVDDLGYRGCEQAWDISNEKIQDDILEFLVKNSIEEFTIDNLLAAMHESTMAAGRWDQLVAGIIKWLVRLRHKGITTLLLNHTTKEEKKSGKGTFYGPVQLANIVDFAFEVVKMQPIWTEEDLEGLSDDEIDKRMNNWACFRLRLEKGRTPKGGRGVFKRRIQYLEGKDWRVTDLEADEAELTEELKDKGDAGLFRIAEMLVEHGQSQGEIAGLIKRSQPTVNVRLKKMVKEGWLEKKRRGYKWTPVGWDRYEELKDLGYLDGQKTD